MPFYSNPDPLPLFYCFCRHSNNSSILPLHGLGRRILHLHLFPHHRHHQCHRNLLKSLPLQGLLVQCLLTSLSHLLLLKLSPPTVLRTPKPSWSTHRVHRPPIPPEEKLIEEAIWFRRRVPGGSGPNSELAPIKPNFS
jgi:hypothetical protein